MSYELRIINYKSNILKILTLLVLFPIILQGISFATTYYVDANNGDDSNPGTSSQPWKTLNRAYTWYSGSGSKVQEGDTVIFRDGNYGEFREERKVGRSDWITYKADTGHKPILTNIYIKYSNYPANENSYLVFDGFRILDRVYFGYTSYVEIRNCEITSQTEPYAGFYAPYIKSGASGIIVREANYTTIENNDIHHVYRGIDEEGSVGSGNYLVIKGNTIHHTGEDGIDASSYSHQIIENNYIYDIHKLRTSMAIMGTKSGNFITGETIILQGSVATGIVSDPNPSYGDLGAYQTSQEFFRDEWRAGKGDTIVGQTSGATLIITDVDPAHTDAIQFDSGNKTDIVIRGNILIREGSGGDQAIKLEPRGTTVFDDVIIENNLIWAPKPIMGSGLTVNVISFNNNTFCSLGNYYGGEGNGIVNDGLSIINMYNNLFGCKQSLTTVANHGNNIFRYNPTGFSINPTEIIYYDVSSLFVDAANGDFRLAQGSAAINFGDPAHAPSIDIEGNTRDAKPDAGCYEYGASTILYGDVSEDSQISAYDAALAAHIAVGLSHPDIKNPSAAEVSGDGEVTAYDAALIAQRAVGLISKFPVEP